MSVKWIDEGIARHAVVGKQQSGLPFKAAPADNLAMSTIQEKPTVDQQELRLSCSYNPFPAISTRSCGLSTRRTRAFAAVNQELVGLYWQIGEYISHKLESTAWGEGVVQHLADYIARTHPGLRGFTRRNLFRMRQFYETYRKDEKVSALLTQLTWSHNLLILGKSKRAEEREFYLRMATSEKWSSRELERQINGALFSA